ncbi:hypothetical protein [Candidatus Nitrospira bockiana]
MVRAKFKVTRIEAGMGMQAKRDPEGRPLKNEKGYGVYAPAEIRTIVMSPVYSDDPASENKRFWDASPSGEIRLGTVNPEAWKQFELDKEYYIDFTPAP